MRRIDIIIFKGNLSAFSHMVPHEYKRFFSNTIEIFLYLETF